MKALWAWLGMFTAGLLAQVETIYLAEQSAKRKEQLNNATRGLEQVDRAMAIKRHLDATDAATVERMRVWYAHTVGGGYKLPSAGGADAEP